MKKVTFWIPVFFILFFSVACGSGSKTVIEKMTSKTGNDPQGSKESTRVLIPSIDEDAVSEMQLKALENVKLKYQDYVNKQKETGKPIRGEGKEPKFFGYYLVAYHKESGEDRYMMKNFTVTDEGKVYLSENQVYGLELQLSEVPALASGEYLSRGMSLIEVNGGNEEKAMAVLKSFIDSALGVNDYKIGLNGYTFLYGNLGDTDSLLMTVLPDGGRYVAHQH